MGSRSMAETIDESFVATFRTMVTHKAQQRNPRFTVHTRMQTDVVGDRDTFDQMYATEGREITGERFTNAALEDPDHQRRSNWIRKFEWRKGLSSQDQVSLLINPQRDYIQSAAYYMVRQKDRLVLEGALGTAYTGKNGEVPVVFPTGDALTGAGNVYTVGGPLTEEVMRIIRQLFDSRDEMLEDMEEGDRDNFCLAVSPVAHRQLLNEVQTTSRDFYMDPVMGRMPLVDGRIPYFMGFRIRVTNLLGLTGSVRRCVAWYRRAVGSSMWQEMTMKVSQRDDLTGLPWQVVVGFSCNSTRLEETGVFAIDVTED